MKKNIALIISILCSIHLFGLYYNIGDFVYFILDFLGFVLIFFDISFRKSKQQLSKTYFGREIKLLFFFLFISAISCYIYHGQNIIETIVAMRYFIFLLLYFQLKKYNLSQNKIENLVISLAIIYILVFFIQVAIFPARIVNTGRIMEADRGLLRFRIEGAGFLMLAGFIGLNKFLIQRNWKNLALYGICMVALFMLGFRTLLAAAIFASLILILRTSSKPSLIIRNFCFLIPLIYLCTLIPFVQNYISVVTESSVSQRDMDSDYIRFLSYDFYMNVVNVDYISLLLGNGFPQENSKYGKFVNSSGVSNGFIFADLGLIGFAIIYGLLTSIVFLWIFLKGIFIKLPKNSQYITAYLSYIVIASFTTVELYRIGIFGVEALVLHLIDTIINKKE